MSSLLILEIWTKTQDDLSFRWSFVIFSGVCQETVSFSQFIIYTKSDQCYFTFHFYRFYFWLPPHVPHVCDVNVTRRRRDVPGRRRSRSCGAAEFASAGRWRGRRGRSGTEPPRSNPPRPAAGTGPDLKTRGQRDTLLTTRYRHQHGGAGQR